jgi:hypothetical protein
MSLHVSKFIFFDIIVVTAISLIRRFRLDIRSPASLCDKAPDHLHLHRITNTHVTFKRAVSTYALKQLQASALQLLQGMTEIPDDATCEEGGRKAQQSLIYNPPLSTNLLPERRSEIRSCTMFHAHFVGLKRPSAENLATARASC